MTKYNLWFSPSENSYELSPDGSSDLVRAQDATIVLEIEAESWEQALRLKHEFLGWEPGE